MLRETVKEVFQASLLIKEKWQGILDCIYSCNPDAERRVEGIPYRTSECRRSAGRHGREPRSCAVGHCVEPSQERCNNGFHFPPSPGKSCHLPLPLASGDAGFWMAVTCAFCSCPPPSRSNHGWSVYWTSCHFLLEFNGSLTLAEGKVFYGQSLWHVGKLHVSFAEIRKFQGMSLALSNKGIQFSAFAQRVKPTFSSRRGRTFCGTFISNSTDC